MSDARAKSELSMRRLRDAGARLGRRLPTREHRLPDRLNLEPGQDASILERETSRSAGNPPPGFPCAAMAVPERTRSLPTRLRPARSSMARSIIAMASRASGETRRGAITVRLASRGRGINDMPMPLRDVTSHRALSAISLMHKLARQLGIRKS
jgi:hypothetical protein